MTARRLSKHDFGEASAAALVAGTVPAIALARPNAAVVGDSASQAALDRLDKAVAELKAMAIAPLLRRALAALGVEDAQSAAELAIEALNLDERNGLAWHVLAIAREKSGDFKSALQAFEAALALSPDDIEIANDLGRLAFRMGRAQAAAQLFAHYHAAKPDDPVATNNLACALRELNRHQEAIDVLKPALLADPSQTLLWNTLGTVMTSLGDAVTAVTFFDEAVRLDPGFARARYNRGNAKLELGDVSGALADCEAAIPGAAEPSDLAMMGLARSTILLCAGRVGEGWDAYEARFDPHFVDFVHFVTEAPRWTPQDDLDGKSMLVFGEQGLGDEVMFANYIPDLIEALGPEGRLTIAVEPRLVELFQRSFPAARIGPHETYKINGQTFRAARFAESAAVDLWTPLAAPLRRFRRSAEAFPDHSGFLAPDPDRVRHWRSLLSEGSGKTVGLLWKSLKLDGARLREFTPFDQWRPVLETPGVRFVNLQYGDCSAELAGARETLGIEIWDPPGIDLKNDLDDVAALCRATDLVIGPANATSNIAAACGAAVWFISNPIGWPKLGAKRYPWYPQARLFTPKRFGEWTAVMAEAADALAAFA
jgi:tetratricopeptide (TPR) repeat protein